MSGNNFEAALSKSLLGLYFSLGFLILVIDVRSQSGIEDKIITVLQDSDKTLYRLAGDYSEKHDVVTIAMLRGTSYREDYDRFIPFFSKKLDSLDVPHMFFQYFVDDKPGTGFDYFIENNANGHFTYDELLALLPRIKRRYETEYQNSN